MNISKRRTVKKTTPAQGGRRFELSSFERSNDVAKARV
jgi:hypothetical protein